MLQMKFDSIRVPEKGLIDAGVVEARHRAAVQSQRPRSDDEVSALQRSVSLCRHLGHVWCRKVLLHDLGIVRQKLWKLAGEIQIVADNDRDGSLQNFRLIPTDRTVDSNVNRCDAARCDPPSLPSKGDGDDCSGRAVGALGG